MELSRVISSLMVGIWRSECSIWLGMYRGAFVTILRILFRSLCSISMFDWDADPHKGAPYFQMGFSTLLYIMSLLARDNLDLRPKAQYIRCSNSPRCLRLRWICGFHVSRRSRWIPRYLTVVPFGMIVMRLLYVFTYSWTVPAVATCVSGCVRLLSNSPNVSWVISDTLCLKRNLQTVTAVLSYRQTWMNFWR